MLRSAANLRRTFTSSVAGPRRPRVVILGTGWGGNKLARGLDKQLYDVRVISPANHFLFTSFLPSTAVGTLEFRAIQEPIRTVKGLGEYYQAKACSINTQTQTIECEDVFKHGNFAVKYDYLVVGCGMKSNDFGTPGVMEREGKEVFFLKHLYHARGIRNRTLECFERATNPTLTEAEKLRLLSFVVVGGGPTSCEFATELSDLLQNDVARWYPDLAPLVQITIVEAGPGILPSFDSSLTSYYSRGLKKRGIEVRTNTGVTSIVESGEEGGAQHFTMAHLADDTELPFGMMVWSAGLAPVKFISRNNSLPKHERGGRLLIDDYLRVPGHNGRVFALGDCAGNAETPLPPLASVAEQQGQYLADCFNEHYKDFDPTNAALATPDPGKVAAPVGKPFIRSLYDRSAEFKYLSVGSMASMGTWGGVVDTTNSDAIDKLIPKALTGSTISGFAAMLAWKGGYMSKQLSWTNMFLIPMFWFKSMVFGRDISRF